VRTCGFFGPWDAYNFVTQALEAVESGIPFEAADDLWVSPTYVPDLTDNSLDLLIDGEQGIWHLANRGQLTWKDFAAQAVRAAGVDHNLIIGKPAAALGLAARRPRMSALASERGWVMPPLDDALARYAESRRSSRAAAAMVEG
jgi:dTDP-4-dehydrorhamnose reductase